MSEEQVDTFLAQLRALLEQAVNAFHKKGMIELEEGELEPLMVELLGAAAMAENPKKLLKSLVKTMVQSDHVAEVYASDQELLYSLKSILEGKGIE